MFRFVSLMVKNSLRNRRRSMLTIGSMAISLCILGVLFALYRALFMASPTPIQALRLVVRHKVSLTQPLPIYYEQKIQAIPGVSEIMTWQWFGGTYKDSRDTRNMFPRFAADADKIFRVHPEFELPEEQKQAFQHERTGCIVTDELATKLNLKLGDRITLVGDIFPVTLELKLVGIYHDPDHNSALYFDREYLRQALGASSGRQDLVGAFSVKAATADDVPRIAQTVDEMFANTQFATKTESEQAFALSFANFIGNIRLFVMAICAAVTFTILLVSANTISMSVRERIREVGILKTLGFTPGEILGIILGESAVMSLMGGIIGCALAVLLCYGVSHSPGATMNAGIRNVSLTPVVGVFCLFVAVLIGLVSSFVPAWGASRTSILESLRYSG